MRSLLFLACPVGMGLMMWLMMRGQGKTEPERPAMTDAQQRELSDLRAELEQLRGGQSRPADPAR